MTINILLAIAAFWFGWWIRVIWTSLAELRNADADLRAVDAKLIDRVQAVEVLVAGNYVTRNEFGVLFHKLDNIEAKIDKKADK